MMKEGSLFQIRVKILKQPSLLKFVRCMMVFILATEVFCHYELLGTLRSEGDDGNENGQKAIGLIIVKQQLRTCDHAFFYISLPSLHDYNVKMPSFMFFRGRKQATTKFSFSFSA